MPELSKTPLPSPQAWDLGLGFWTRLGGFGGNELILDFQLLTAASDERSDWNRLSRPSGSCRPWAFEIILPLVLWREHLRSWAASSFHNCKGSVQGQKVLVMLGNAAQTLSRCLRSMQASRSLAWNNVLRQNLLRSRRTIVVLYSKLRDRARSCYAGTGGCRLNSKPVVAWQ